MGIQYVTVKIDTTGLYQPLSSAVGVVGIVGPAPAAGMGFANPMLFTRPLTGAASEPYARVVPVLSLAPLVADVQTLSVTGAPTAGTFALAFAGQTTGALAFTPRPPPCRRHSPRSPALAPATWCAAAARSRAPTWSSPSPAGSPLRRSRSSPSPTTA